MGRGRLPACSSIDATDFHTFFADKVSEIRSSTANSPPPLFTSAPAGCVFDDFRSLSADDVITLVRTLPDKQCASDPLPTSLLKENVDILAPFLVELFNRCLSSGSVPSLFKSAFVTPLIKKSNLDPSDTRSYRPISNLSVLSKLLERLVARQFIDYLNLSGLLPELQSAYRAFHSTETAVLKVLADILREVDAGNLVVLVLLDLSAAFDTVDHATLLERLKTSYGLGGTVLDWFTSYLSGRTQHVRCGNSSSVPTPVTCGIPQGSVLGPILFILYTAFLSRLIQNHGLNPHMYADDTQIYGACSPAEVLQLQQRVAACIDDVAAWMRENRLQFNAAKTEVIWCATSRRQYQIPHNPIRVGLDDIHPVSSVRDLGIFLDSDISMKKHVAKTVSSCFAVLRQIRSIRRSVTRPVVMSLITALVMTKLDYGNATLAGLPSR